jgi:hypothetical protein
VYVRPCTSSSGALVRLLSLQIGFRPKRRDFGVVASHIAEPLGVKIYRYAIHLPQLVCIAATHYCR